MDSFESDSSAEPSTLTAENFDRLLSLSLLDQVEFGLIVLDARGRILLFNRWLSLRCSIHGDSAIGLSIIDFFPALKGSRLHYAIKTALNHKMTSLISSSIDQPLLPLMDKHQKPIIQSITVKPLEHAQLGNLCLIQVEDVTASTQRESQFSAQAKAMKEMAEKHQIILNTIDEGFIQFDAQGTIYLSNNTAGKMFGCSSAELINRPIQSLFEPTDKNQAFSLSALPSQYSLEAQGIRLDGSRFPLAISFYSTQFGKSPLQFAILRDISVQKKVESQLHQEKERAQVTLLSIADAVITTDETGRILSLNPAAERLTGWSGKKAQGRPIEQIFYVIEEQSRNPAPNPVQACLQRKETITNDEDYILISRNGDEFAITASAAPVFDFNHNQLGAVLVFRDVSHTRRLSAQLAWQASHDPLTALPNRREFKRCLQQLVDDAKLNHHSHSLLYIDLDQFKVVNDTCGHAAGDNLLCQLADLLKTDLRKEDVLARLGGDEFGVLLPRCSQKDAIRIANLLRKRLEDFRFAWHNNIFRIGVSIGLTMITNKTSTAEEILSAADSACYVAKDTGRNRVFVHDPENNDPASSNHRETLQWAAQIQKALDENRFCLFLQNIAYTHDPTGISPHVEVLIRMFDQKGQLIPPGAFIPAAERYSLMGAIDQWVIKELFGYLDNFEPEEFDQLPVYSINLSGISLSQEDFLEHIQDQIQRSQIPATKLCFEITETAAIANMKKVVHFITSLKDKGCRFALDDFGSGLSSFAYLKSLPVDYLKIDGYFVKDIATDPLDRVFVESINQIGHAMGLKTIAEFVENDDIVAVLREIGVDYVQGYGVARPEPFLNCPTTRLTGAKE